MARSINTIRQEIITEKEKYSQLSSLNNNAPTSIWRLWVYVVAAIAFLEETLWDVFKVELTEIADRAIAGTREWYNYISLQFQLGDALIWDEDNLGITYETLDTSKQIINLASVREGALGVLQIKVAKQESGEIVPLTESEKTAFTAYIDKVKFAGTFISVISDEADLLKVDMRIFHDGITPLFDLKTSIKSAIDNYLINLPFDGVFRIISLLDAIQAIQGVVDIKVNSVEAKGVLSSYQTVDVSYVSYSGYMKIDPTFPLESVLQYEVVT